MRLFVALDIPDAVRRTLREFMARLKPECTGARWVRPEGIHITLKFLGETEGAKLDSIKSALSSLDPVGPIQLEFRGIGFFPNEFHPRVIWCGVEASPNLTMLAASVDRALQPLGFPPETRAFTPHLTLARFDSHKGLDTLVRAANNLKSYDFGSARQSEFYLYQSVLKRGGAEYTRLATFLFAEKA
ncbi:MAG: RNA 2',3'-cyclic phosphodiesterase [Candidatus Acidiferrales bacterium]|jgi:RNA 2',3'-cyclic 3'-phosphodiesterase